MSQAIIEVKIRKEDDHRPWEDIEAAAIKADEYDEMVRVFRKFNGNLHIKEVRWNHPGSQQGYYQRI